MIVHFVASTRNFQQNIHIYRRIIDEISLLNGLHHDFLERKKWNDKTLQIRVADFLCKYQEGGSLEFNLGSRINNYFDVQSKAGAISKEAILRCIVTEYLQGKS